ncbi:MAG: ATPase, partial [Candidatus Bathyarchaeia archaeon]
AIRILREAGTELGRAAGAVIRRLGLRGAFTVALNGGVFQLGEPLCTSFVKTVRQVAPECSITPARFEPAVGAALIALKELGVEVDEALLGRVEASLHALGR